MNRPGMQVTTLASRADRHTATATGRHGAIRALQQMNAAGATAFAGWTWRYEYCAGCRLRAIKRYEDRPTPMIEYVLIDHVVGLVPYRGSGFGVKAYPRAKPGSADLFDARTEAQAKAFVADVQRLLTACGNPPASSR